MALLGLAGYALRTTIDQRRLRLALAESLLHEGEALAANHQPAEAKDRVERSRKLSLETRTTTLPAELSLGGYLPFLPSASNDSQRPPRARYVCGGFQRWAHAILGRRRRDDPDLVVLIGPAGDSLGRACGRRNLSGALTGRPILRIWRDGQEDTDLGRAKGNSRADHRRAWGAGFRFMLRARRKHFRLRQWGRSDTNLARVLGRGVSGHSVRTSIAFCG